MMRTTTIAGFILAVCFIACNTADQKLPQMADDMCNCFKSLEDSLSAETKTILINGSNSPDPQQSFADALQALDEEKRLAVSMEFMSFQDAQSSGTPLNNCIMSFEEKYKNERTADKEKFARNLVRELESKKDCKVTAAIMRMGLKEQFK